MANFEFTEKSEIHTAWFIGHQEIPLDWLAMVYRDAPDQPWKMTCRFRRHNPESEGRNIHDHQDRFDGATVTPRDGDIERLIAATDRVADQILLLDSRLELCRNEVHGGMEKLMEIWKDHGFLHVKQEYLQ